ncbi:thioesterase family protein [Nocardioides panacisoli]|uniref:thioesterase family protein n=1 Tax=Nocardioides panacisoli TaxID=627624 RepID=UPI001C63162E|nr:thioesterase family protein [Nocardioides panacisoli]QYJ05105.1 thioesterase family protein [Nocardioides panacisoli]
MAYFERTGDHAFTATTATGGAWQVDEQHIAPAMGLLTHLVEEDRRARGRDDLVLGRLGFDILGPVPVAPVETSVRTVRPGRSIELVEARMAHAGRDVLVLRAWLLQPRDTTAVAGPDPTPLPGPDAMAPWDPTTVWPGGFIASIEVRRAQVAPGRATYWARTEVPLVDGDVSPVARVAGLFDIANGMTVRENPAVVAFPNLDLTAHLHRVPTPGWLGFDTTVTFGADGLGLTSSVLHDLEGPFGVVNQTLTVRPSPSAPPSPATPRG